MSGKQKIENLLVAVQELKQLYFFSSKASGFPPCLDAFFFICIHTY